MTSVVSETPFAASDLAAHHFAGKLSFETDCADVEQAFANGTVDFVLLDVRGPQLYAQAHVPGAINLPHGKMTERRMAEWPMDTLFVVYCQGTQCNGSTKAALRLARQGRPVKEMIGGLDGWIEDKFAVASLVAEPA
jgi:rhodanese-related sulfurtransferase